MSRREALEEELSELSSKLLNVLDISDELIILINEQLNIAYTNDKAIQVFNRGRLDQETESSLLGQAIGDFILPQLLAQLKKVLHEKPAEAYTIDLADEQGDKTVWHASIKYVDESEKPYLALVIAQHPSKPDTNKQSSDTMLTSLSIELTESRRKINEIEGALRHVMTSPDHVSEEEDSANTSLPAPEKSPESQTNQHRELESPEHIHKELIVSLLRSSLNLWERSTNKSKIDLAEQSRCWRVYVDGTTVKTRTFDKYLSARTVPDRPRWRAVVRTANYVLANCELADKDRMELSELTRQVEDIYP